MDIEKFLKQMGMKDQQPTTGQWDRVIQPNSSYLIIGDVGTGKSALAHHLLETFSQKYNLLPAASPDTDTRYFSLPFTSPDWFWVDTCHSFLPSYSNAPRIS